MTPSAPPRRAAAALPVEAPDPEGVTAPADDERVSALTPKSISILRH